MQLCFFEDRHASNFHPLTLTRPVSDLRVGILTIREKWELHLQLTTSFSIESSYMTPTKIGDSLLKHDKSVWVNNRTIPSKDILEAITTAPVNSCIVNGPVLIAIITDSEQSEQIINNRSIEKVAASLPKTEHSNNTQITYLWDLFSANVSEIKEDILLSNFSNIDLNSYPSITVSNPDNVYVGSNVTIEPGSILIADEGPIVLGNNVHIQAGAMIRGAASIGEHTTINMGAKIRGGTTIGPHCKIGGEVSSSIFHSYSNKGHDGFVGHSLIGQWVNLGADTNTSNLKNNYSAVRITDWNTKQNVDTEQQFFGSVIGDHSKTSINTMLNTGTICGVCSNIFSSGFPPKFIPSFSWVGDDIQEYRFDKAKEAMAAMMKRRNITLSEQYLAMMESISDNR